MTPQELATILQEIHRQQDGQAMGPSPALPQVNVQPQEPMPPDVSAPIAQPQDDVAPSPPPAAAAPAQAPPRVPTGDDARVASLQAILAQQSQRPAAAPHGFMNDFLKPMAAGIAYGNKAPEVMQGQQELKDKQRQQDIQNTVGQLQEIRQRQNDQSTQERQGRMDQLAQNEDSRAAALQPLTIKKLEAETTPKPVKPDLMEVTPGRPVIDQNNPSAGPVYTAPPPPAPPTPAPNTPFELWAQQNPNAKVSEWFAMQPKDGTAATNAATARTDKSYQFTDSNINTLAKPITDSMARFSRLQDTINETTPQADSLIAPELITVMAGGQGSGVRINTAEIQSVLGGRSNVESLKAALNKWQIDPTKALSVTPAQREQMKSLLGVVYQKLNAKQQAITNAQQQLSTSTDVMEHRKIESDLKAALSDANETKPPAAPDAKPQHMILNGKTLTLGTDGKYH